MKLKESHVSVESLIAWMWIAVRHTVVHYCAHVVL